jgi:dienelactone hydrolase
MADHAAELADFDETTFTHEGKTRTVYRMGTGPAVIVIHEMPGITPEVAGFGRRVAAAGFTAVLPALFGEPGKPLGAGYAARGLAWGCVSKEFSALATASTSPITVWVRALGAQMHEECGGPGIGAVGMCFTGGFALAMMVDDRLLAPVLSQPSLPFPLTRKHKADIGIGGDDLARVKERAAAGTCVLGLRFTADRAVPPERFETLRRELGDAFVAVEIDSGPGNPWGIKRIAHSVLTNDFVDEPGHPTREALDQVLALFSEKLLSSPA